MDKAEYRSKSRELKMFGRWSDRCIAANRAINESEFLFNVLEIEPGEEREQYIASHKLEKDKLCEYIFLIIYPQMYDVTAGVSINDEVVECCNNEAMMIAINQSLKYYRKGSDPESEFDDLIENTNRVKMNPFVGYVSVAYIKTARAMAKREEKQMVPSRTVETVAAEVLGLAAEEGFSVQSALDLILAEGKHNKKTIDYVRNYLMYNMGEINTQFSNGEDIGNGENELYPEDEIAENTNVFFSDEEDGEEFGEKLGNELFMVASKLEGMTINKRSWTMQGYTGRILKELKYKDDKPIGTTPSCNAEHYLVLKNYKDILVNRIFDFGFIEFLLQDCMKFPFRSFEGVSYNLFKEGRSVQQKYLAEYRACAISNVSQVLSRHHLNF